jgi:hypothetical protein
LIEEVDETLEDEALLSKLVEEGEVASF